MTTILKASREIEQGGAAETQLPTARADRFPVPLVVSIALILLGLVGGALAVVLILSRHDVSESVTTRVPASGAPVHVASPPAVPQLQALPAQQDVPRARVEKNDIVAPPAARRPAPAMPGAAVREVQRPPVKAPPKGEGSNRPPVPGEAGLRVHSIVYTSDPAQRRVTLQLAGAQAVTLREGQSASGVEVQLILPNEVYIRQGTSVFAVVATP